MNQIRLELILKIFFNVEVGHFRLPNRSYIRLRQKPVVRAVKCCADEWLIFLDQKASKVILTISTSIIVIFLNTVSCFVAT